MLKNYFVIAFRHFTKHRLFSAINVLCLSIGITFSMIIGVYVMNQQRVNSDLRNVERQYYLKTIWKEKDLGSELTSISPLAKAVKEEYPDLVANYFRYNPVTNVVSAGDKHFKEDIAICDTTLVAMYGFPLLYGDKNNAFPNSSSAVITETLARKLFGTTDAIGKTTNIQTTVAGITQDYMVSAVLKDIPFNSVTHLLGNSYSVYVPTTGSRYYQIGDPSLPWDFPNEISFIELKPGVKHSSVIDALNRLLKKYSSDFIWKNLSSNAVPVKDYYLNDNNGAVKKMCFVLTLIAGFILLMVIINFVNINIGTSTYRLKEIGLRKTFGSARKQVIGQFLLESLMLTGIAAVFSVFCYQLLIPVFSKVLNSTLPSFWQFEGATYFLFALLVFAIGILAGIYPAFVLSAINLIHAVKGKLDTAKGSLGLKRALVVVQFSLAMLVFICALNLSKQVTYIFNKDLGYNKDQLLVITAFPKQWDSAGVAKMETVKQQLLQVPHVKSVSLAFDLPESTPYGRIILYPPKESSAQKQVSLPWSSVDEDYAKTFGIPVKAGSFFANERSGTVLNETAVKQLGLSTENAVGRKIETPGGPTTITGVIGDYNFSSLQEAIGPVGFSYVRNSNTYRYLVVKLQAGDLSTTMDVIRSKWKSMLPNAPFDYTFMDDKFQAMYRSELQLKTAAEVATALNLIIVLLGILGLVAFTLNKRMKEIAIRKVLGARAANIILLFLKEYAFLIIVANAIAWPLAYFSTEHFLQNFAYRIQQDIVPYLLVLGAVSAMALGLISLQCIKTAIANPVKTLRTE
ncbi:ABC transporter permease [Longitalea arenae]|uniref:ABC transporter permease n=1 Tax=Longitalea arenae TaxID=2812558 RepID=UPI00196811C6|nr:ABC transporter permease [Longitalea arenae]